jgi:hypothetical protein
MDLPLGIDRERHYEVRGREGTWLRPVAVALTLALVVLGLFNVFGQRAVTSTATGAAATLSVNAPERLRSGLLFTPQIRVHALRPLHDMTLRFSQGWFQAMTFNGMSPAAQTEGSDGGWQVFRFGPVHAGQTVTVWMSFQANPTEFAGHAQVVQLADGADAIVTVSRSLFVFP